ncbi:hypothetical protein [Amycolatopsis kentuckyensis]|nr:hypothetical protein [Amycolatopsis kentuckyensis]
MSDETTEGPTCSKCGQAPAGPGGILCPACLAAIQAQRPLG